MRSVGEGECCRAGACCRTNHMVDFGFFKDFKNSEFFVKFSVDQFYKLQTFSPHNIRQERGLLCLVSFSRSTSPSTRLAKWRPSFMVAFCVSWDRFHSWRHWIVLWWTRRHVCLIAAFLRVLFLSRFCRRTNTKQQKKTVTIVPEALVLLELKNIE